MANGRSVLKVVGMVSALALGGCARSTESDTELPLVTPPVRAATPTGLGGTASARRGVQRDALIDSQDIKSRFFTTGPTSIFRILTELDDRITAINASGTPNCLSQAPVQYTLAPFGQSISFFAQCFQSIGSGGDFLQFGQNAGITYFYSRIGVGPVAARLTPDSNTPGTWLVETWLGIGDGFATGGSYGVIRVQADSSSDVFEMTVAGHGFGYCGAQLKSDATHLYVEGSTDMGTSCNPSETTCVAAADISTPAVCTPAQRQFALPALGTTASGYPGGGSNTITLDGTPSDSVHFGPTVPTPGVSPL